MSVLTPKLLDYGRATSKMPMTRRKVRWIAFGVLTAVATILSVAVWLKPDPRGFGTHQQLGMAPCGSFVLTGLPCPTCGMTTAFAYTVRGQWLKAATAQPTGFLLALGTAAAGVYALQALALGRWPRWPMPLFTPYRFFFSTLILLLGGWGIKLVIGLATHQYPVRVMP